MAARRSPPPGAAIAAVVLLAIGGPAARATPQPRLDLAVMATYLYKLEPFVDWPADARADAASGFDICVVGDDPFGPMLDHVVAGQQVDGRPIVIRRIAVATRDAPCRIMFVAGSHSQSVRDALHVMRGAAVLTVTDDQPNGGVIDFVIDQGRVHFRIDDQAAADDGLVISSKLLSLALAVNPRQGAGARR